MLARSGGPLKTGSRPRNSLSIAEDVPGSLASQSLGSVSAWAEFRASNPKRQLWRNPLDEMKARTYTDASRASPRGVLPAFRPFATSIADSSAISWAS